MPEKPNPHGSPGADADHQRWWLYIADCDGRLYTGITTDVERRMNEHRRGLARAARFTRAAERVALIYHAAVGDRSTALRLERRVKQLSRERKLAIVNDSPDGSALVQKMLSGM